MGKDDVIEIMEPPAGLGDICGKVRFVANVFCKMYLGEAFAECRVQHNLASTIMYLHITTTSSAGDAE